ncbi:O-antigen ligase family protein [Enterococcus casseliflavus]|uniref:O-antigen ligase family protein n=1 Tax=Enterococcus casseliflavus TaxID=37734 RepID=UPI001E3A73C1|nr:hypothetical protein [Enterococcus casseliflavus]MCD4961905.1 hypothetical protein [Enterococcus casseliflavus]
MYLLFFLFGFFMFKGNIIILGQPFLYFEIFTYIVLILLFFLKKLRFMKFSKFIYLLILQNFLLAFNTGNFGLLQGAKNSISMLFILITFSSLSIHVKVEEKIKYFLYFIYGFELFSLVSILRIVIENSLYDSSTIYMYKSLFILPYGESNYVASFFLFFGLFQFTIFFENRFSYFDILNRINKIIFLFFMIIAPVLILILNSRTSILAYIITVAIISLKNSKNNLKKVAILVLSSVFIIVYFQKNTNFISLIFDRFLNENNNVSYRFNQFSLVLRDISNGNIFQLFFGNGYGSDKITYGILIHNLILKLLYSLGIFGTSIYLYIYYVLAGLGKRLFFFSMFGLLLGSMFEPILFTNYFDSIMMIIIGFFLNNDVKNQDLLGVKDEF